MGVAAGAAAPVVSQFEIRAVSWRVARSLPICLAESIGADMIPKHTTAEEMALTVGVDPNTFRDALRGAKFPRKRSTDWQVKIGGPAYSGMRTVLATLIRRKAA